MANKFKVGDLVECGFLVNQWGHQIVKMGIVLEIGLDYPDTGEQRSRFALVRWSDGREYHLWKNYGNGYTKTKVVGK